MDWLNPAFLWALLLAPIAAGLYLWAAWQRREALRRFGAAPLVARLADSVSPRRRRYKATLVVTACALLGLALAGPRFGTKLREVKRQGVDLVIALDVSLSMQAEDVLPSRLARAKFELNTLTRDLRGDRVGLILFAGDAFVQCPMTLDYSAIRLFLDVADPSMIPTPGTDFAAAVRTAVEMLDASTDENDPTSADRSRALLIVSDGEDFSPDLEEALRLARQAGIILFTAGVGETQGVPIPLYQNGRHVGYKEDRDGQVVSTRLGEEVLRDLARDGGYYRISRTTSSLSELKDALARLQQTEFDAQIFEEYAEKFQWPLAFGLVLLFLDLMVSDRRRTRRTKSNTQERDETANES